MDSTVRITRFDWSKVLMLDRFFGKTHSHKREKTRRVNQIQRGILKAENGLTP